MDEKFSSSNGQSDKKDPKIGMIFCNYYLVDKKGSIIDQFVRHDFLKKVKLLDQPKSNGACSLINVKCLKLIGGYDEKFKSQDGVDLWIRLIQKYKVKNVNLPLFYYRQHGKNLTSNQRKLFYFRDQILKFNAKNKKIKNTICIIPIRGLEEDTISFKKINNQTILYKIINEIKKTDNIKNNNIISRYKNFKKSKEKNIKKKNIKKIY